MIAQTAETVVRGAGPSENDKLRRIGDRRLAGHVAANVKGGLAADQTFAGGRMVGGQRRTGGESRRTTLLGRLLP